MKNRLSNYRNFAKRIKENEERNRNDIKDSAAAAVTKEKRRRRRSSITTVATVAARDNQRFYV